MLWLVLGASLSTGAQLWEENLLCLLSTLPFGHCGEQYFPVYDQLEVIALGSCHFSWDHSPPLQCTRFHPSLTLSTDVLRVFPVLSSQYQHQPLGVITSTDHPLAGLRTTNHHALRPLFHPIFCPPHALINPMSLHLGQKTFMEGSIHELTLKKVNNTHCPSLVHMAPCFTVESDQGSSGFPLEDPLWVFMVSNCSAWGWILNWDPDEEDEEAWGNEVKLAGLCFPQSPSPFQQVCGMWLSPVSFLHPLAPQKWWRWWRAVLLLGASVWVA